MDKQLCFLIVEDNRGDLILLKKLIERAAIAVSEIFHAAYLEDVENFRNRSIDLVFLDLRLPDSDGLATYSRVKDIMPDIPVVILSGVKEMSIALQAISLGAQDYLVKGEFDEKLLSKTIAYAIERSKSLGQLKDLQRQLAEQALMHQKLITEATILGQERERQQIGRELHDNINQVLSTVRMYLEIFLNGDGKERDLVMKAFKNVTEAIQSVRELSKHLVTPTLSDIGINEALKELMDDYRANKQLKIMYQSKMEGEMPEHLALVVFRVAQEQLNNILKHAEARNVRVLLDVNSHTVLEIEDDGKGFDITRRCRGIGLQNIKNRVEFYKGSVQINSAPGKGCKLVVRIPISNI